VIEPSILSPGGEVLETLLVGDLQKDQVVALDVPVARHDGVLHHEGDGSVDPLGALGTRFEISSDDDVQLEVGFGLTVNGTGSWGSFRWRIERGSNSLGLGSLRPSPLPRVDALRFVMS